MTASRRGRGRALALSVSTWIGAVDAGAASCPAEMVRVEGYCVDRWEGSLVDDRTGEALSPYHPPDRRLLEEVWLGWEIERGLYGDAGARAMPLPEVPAIQRGPFTPRAVSRASVVPQGYMSYPLAREACERAGKRLCTRTGWVRACRGERGHLHPYGPTHEAGACNVWGPVHPGVVLHDDATFGHRDPRLNLLDLGGAGPLLRVTQASPRCASRWAAGALYDMVGNLDEWVQGDKDGRPEFVGGFYARSTRGGCEARVTNHAPAYHDYSTGLRCCRDAD